MSFLERHRKNIFIAIALLVPPLLLLTYFLLNRFDYHSDDVGYWLYALAWRRVISERPLGQVLWGIFESTSSRASYFMFVGVPFLWLTGSAHYGTYASGFFFLSLSSIFLYLALRSLRCQRVPAALGAAAIGSFPLWIIYSRALLPDAPLCALSLISLTCLLRGKLALFSIVYVLALLLRPFETVCLIPAYSLLYVSNGGTVRGLRSFGICLAIAFAAATAAFWKKLGVFRTWSNNVAFSASKESFLSHLSLTQENLAYVIHALWVMFGVTGSALLIYSFYLSWRHRREYRVLAHSGIFLNLVLFLALISFFENPDTRATFGRYSLVFVAFALVSTVSIVFHFAKPWPRNVLLGAFAVANIFVCVGASVGEPAKKYLVWSGPMSHSYFTFRFHHFFVENAELVPLLEPVLPPKNPRFILFAGRDPQLLPFDNEMGLSLSDRFDTKTAKHLFQYREGVFAEAVKIGIRDISAYGISAVVFARHERVSGDKTAPYPNAAFVEALERGQENKLGLQRYGSISWPTPQGSQELEIYYPIGQEIAGSR